jgi:hypothetical protein
VGKKYVAIIILIILILFLFLYANKMIPFSVFQPNVIYQGAGKVPTNLQIDNEILDFDRGEKSFNWTFEMSDYYTAGCCSPDCQKNVGQDKYYWVVKLDGKVIDKGEGYKDLTGCSGSSGTISWKVSGKVYLPDDIQIGRHYLEVVVATLPKRPWTTSSAELVNGCVYLGYWYSTLACSCTKYTSGSCNGYCDNSASQCLAGDADVSYVEEGCLLKRCGYNSCIQPLGKDKLFQDLANGYVCKDAVETEWDTCYNTYINNCDKCGINSTQEVLVFEKLSNPWGTRQNNCPGSCGSYCCNPTIVYCPYDKCVLIQDVYDPYYRIAYYDVPKGGNLCAVSSWNWMCSYCMGVRGYNTQYICNNCTLAEPCNPHPKINTEKENTYRSMFTITSLTKDFVVCKGGQCVLQVQCTKDSDCPTPCDGVACYCGSDNYCHCAGSCITQPPQEKGIWAEIVKIWNSFWAWILSKLGWL